MGLSAGDQRGSVLIIAVIAMLIMGVLSVSFALLADIETKIGVNYKQQAQAEALAEAGLEVARDAIRSAVGVPDGFTRWIGGPLLANGAALGPGRYWARIDNDCPPLVPAAIQQPGPPNGVACPTTTDSNQTAVLTAWAVAGTGRARVRAVVGVDNPWKHVCAGARPDNNGYCNDPSNQNGNPVIRPADPNDPNGPAAYDDLPRPILGCSRIDPGVHGAAALCATLPMPKLFAQPATGPYPAYPALPPGGPRLVLMGEDPDLPVPPGAPAPKLCFDGGPGYRYFGYFDCALSTPCIPPGAGPVRIYPGSSITVTGSDYCPESGNKVVRGCVKEGDPRLQYSNLFRRPGPNGCLGPDPTGALIDSNQVNAAPATGMVFNFPGATGFEPNTEVGTCPTPPCPPNAGGGRNLYVLGGTTGGGNGVATIQSATVRGTLVVEGNASTSASWCTGPNRDVALLNNGTLTTEAEHRELTALYALRGLPPHRVYGYPLALVIYDPTLPYPTVSPTYAPQPTCADMGSSNTLVNGMVYSGGHVQFNPISVNGSVVGFELQTQGGARAVMNYNVTYGNAAPPPGFPAGAGNQVIVIRKSFIVCATYNDETGGATACN